MKIIKNNWMLTLALLVGAVFSTTACDHYYGNGVKGDGNVVKQERKVSSFSGIDVGGAFKVFLTQGEEEKVVVEADENLLQDIETEVRAGTLKITTTREIQNPKALNVFITFKSLDDLEVSGACQLVGENTFKLASLDLDCSGASEVSLKLTADNLEIDISGASNVDMFGSAQSVALELSGAAKLDAIELEVQKLDADVSGASNGKIYVTGELSADVSGASNLKYKGEPSISSVDVSGAATLKKY